MFNGSDGRKVITQVFDEFDRQRKRLSYGIGLCKEQLGRNDESISSLKEENNLLVDSMQQASGLMTSIDKLLGRESGEKK